MADNPGVDGALWIAPDRRLVVPVVSGGGGAGRTTVAAWLAAGLHRHTLAAPTDARVTAVFDCGARGYSPWPSWVDDPAQAGTATLAGFRGAAAGADADLAHLAEASASHLRIAAGTPLRVLTDTGPASGSYLGADCGPRWWLPLIPQTRCAVVDADGLEGARLAAQAAGGPFCSLASWFATPFLNVAAVWVTERGPDAAARTLDALTRAAEVRLPMDRVIVVVCDRRGGRRGRGGRAAPDGPWRELIEARCGALIEIGHDPALAEQGGRPDLGPQALDRPELAALLYAVAEAARLPWIPAAELDSFDPGAAPPASLMPEMLLRQAGKIALR
jgi:hypothetical protein